MYKVKEGKLITIHCEYCNSRLLDRTIYSGLFQGYLCTICLTATKEYFPDIDMEIKIEDPLEGDE